MLQSVLTWSAVEAAVQQLAAKITTKPDAIVAVVRGGLIPARLLARQLGVTDMYALTVTKKDREARTIVTKIQEDLTGKQILLVEDVLESGASLLAAKEYLESLGANVQTAALYIQPESQLAPDYYIETKGQVPVFPWD